MDAFSTQVVPYISSLQRLAWRITRNAEDAEDVCQESLMKAFAKFDQFAGPEESAKGGFRCWLMKITANSAIDLIRRKQGRRLVPLDECEQIRRKWFEAGASGWGENPEAGYLRREQICVLAEAINRLPEELRKVCFLRNVNDLSTKDVAARLRLSSVAVRLRLFRAHSQLRKNLRLVHKGRGPARARGNCGVVRRNEGGVLQASGLSQQVSGRGTTNPNIVESRCAGAYSDDAKPQKVQMLSKLKFRQQVCRERK